MSLNYAESLSKYDNKGICGLPEIIDSQDELDKKCQRLSEMLLESKHAVLHTGAGVSTAAGIPDFRGPQGVWTKERQREKIEGGVPFDRAQPTLTHQIVKKMMLSGLVKYVVSQNVDGLHLRSGLPRECLSELHGNVMMERCERCGREYLREVPVATIGLKYTGGRCQGGGARGRCRGLLRDTVLDWEDPLPQKELDNAERHSRLSDLNICLGTTLQINPAGELPLYCKKNKKGNLVICNLQPTKLDSEADLILHGYVDHIMERVWQLCESRLAPALVRESFVDVKGRTTSGAPTAGNHIH